MESVLNGRLKHRENRSETRAKQPKENDHLRQVERWGMRYVVAACGLSSGLNAWANVDMCGSDSVLACSAAGMLGAVIPGLVDSNLDGVIDATDFAKFKNNFGADWVF
jgi:hypothetical protein